MVHFHELFYVDSLSVIMIVLVGFVGLSVASFSSRYLKGDRKKGVFYSNLTALTLSISIMVSADQLFVLFGSWVIGNILLTRLMLHKREWDAARHSSRLALKNFVVGATFLASSFVLDFFTTGETSIQAIIHSSNNESWINVSICLMFLAIMTQSALWPFHRWLISSLNSPTPVSAIMHAGLVNGGGYMLARFAPIFLEKPAILNGIFIIGIISALLGTLWKLMQSDVKRMLACSTMGQMGFMIAQCGLGLFPAAVAHLCWHGLFKAYLFLGSGAAGQEKRFDLDEPPDIKYFLLALICGAFGAYGFAITSDKTIFIADTNLFLVLLAMIAGTQFSLSIIRNQSLKVIPIALIATSCMGGLYGSSVYIIEYALDSVEILGPQPLNVFHLVGLLLLIISWLAMVFRNSLNRIQSLDWMLNGYVFMFNASQPDPKTVTAHRNHYQF